MNIFDLPNDALAEIWHYFPDSRDAISFGMVCKSAQKVSWMAIRDLGVNNAQLLEYTLSMDLSHIRALEIIITARDRHLKANLDSFLKTMEKFPNLANASNLRALLIQLPSGKAMLPFVDSISNTVARLTNLDTLWLAYELPDSLKFDLGNLLKNHNSLTRLTISSDNACTNFAQLTQLKSLDVSESRSNSSDESISQICAMTNLQQLSLGDTERVSPALFDNFTKLSNLEMLMINESATPSTFLKFLPNLSSLALSFLIQCNIDRDILGNLTNLTSLFLELFHHQVDVASLTGLTNLQFLSASGILGEEDLSTMTRLTNLVMIPRHSALDLANVKLPLSLKRLSMPDVQIQDEDVALICRYTSLTDLDIRSIADDIQLFSNLHNLESLSVEKLSKEQALVLRVALPNLKFLTLKQVKSAAVPELLKFTQLSALRYFRTQDPADETDLLKAPFPVSAEQY